MDIKILKRIKKIQVDIPKVRVEERKRHEDTAIAIIEENFAKLSKEQIERIMDFLDLDWYGAAPPSYGRFAQLFALNRPIVLGNDLIRLNDFFFEVYWNENLDSIENFIGELEGVRWGFPSCLLYLKNREKYNILIPATEKGIETVFPTETISGEFKERYLHFNRLANEIKEKCKLAPQEMDIILANLGSS